MSPFEAVYGYAPPAHVPFEPGSTADPEVERQLRTRDDLWGRLKTQAAAAQNRMRQVYDRGRRDREFVVGEHVWLKWLPRGQQSLLDQPQSKLSPRYYGPFRVLERIGRAAYRLQLPPRAVVHPVFHVTRLKPFKGQLGEGIEIPIYMAEPQRIVRTRRVQRQEQWIDEVLVEWAGAEERYMWEDLEDMTQRYPALRTLGQVQSKGGGFVTYPPLTTDDRRLCRGKSTATLADQHSTTAEEDLQDRRELHLADSTPSPRPSEASRSRPRHPSLGTRPDMEARGS
ncbi:unnamed protein product [Victoria cruziana]